MNNQILIVNEYLINRLKSYILETYGYTFETASIEIKNRQYIYPKQSNIDIIEVKSYDLISKMDNLHKSLHSSFKFIIKIYMNYGNTTGEILVEKTCKETDFNTTVTINYFNHNKLSDLGAKK